MTCLELMKKLRPDLSEEDILEWCPHWDLIHMRGINKELCREVTEEACRICWNREVDEEMLYFRDEKESLRKELVNEQSLIKYINELEFENEKLSEELDISREANRAIEKNFVKFRDEKNKTINERHCEIAELKEKNKELERRAIELIKENDELKKEIDRTLKEKIDFSELEMALDRMKILKESLEKENKSLFEENEKISDAIREAYYIANGI